MPVKEHADRLHDQAVRDIARERFAYPTPKYPSFKTYVNKPEPSMAVRLGSGRAGYPDIVVVDATGNVLKILAEVETEGTVNEEEAERKWRPHAALAPLYLYVPAGYSDRAKKIASRLKIPIVGLRTWRYIVGLETIEIVDIDTQPLNPLEKLMPAILPRRRAVVGPG